MSYEVLQRSPMNSWNLFRVNNFRYYSPEKPSNPFEETNIVSCSALWSAQKKPNGIWNLQTVSLKNQSNPFERCENHKRKIQLLNPWIDIPIGSWNIDLLQPYICIPITISRLQNQK